MAVFLEDMPTVAHSENVTFLKSAVPAYLQHSDFYLSLSDDNEEISVPKNVLKPDLDIKNESDLKSLLTSLRFWGVDKIPQELIVFFLSREHGSKEVCEEFVPQLEYLTTLRSLSGLDKTKQLKIVFQSQNLQILNGLHDLGWDVKDSWRDAIDTGNASILQFVHTHGATLGEDSFQRAVRTGQLDCVKYLHENGVTKSLWLNPFTMSAAAGGHLGVLQYLYEQGFPWDQFVQLTAAQRGHFECFKYTVQHDCLRYEGAVNVVITTGQVDFLEYLFDNGFQGDEMSCLIASNYNHLHCLRLLHQKNVPWEADTTRAAASTSLECLKYLHENSCPWNAFAYVNAVASNNLECLGYLHSHGCPFDADVYTNNLPVNIGDRSPVCAAYVEHHLL